MSLLTQCINLRSCCERRCECVYTTVPQAREYLQRKLTDYGQPVPRDRTDIPASLYDFLDQQSLRWLEVWREKLAVLDSLEASNA